MVNYYWFAAPLTLLVIFMHEDSYANLGRFKENPLNSSRLSGGQPVCAPEKEPQVVRCLNSASNAADRLHDRIDTLANRLQPIINCGNEKTSGAGAPCEVVVPLASQIRMIDDRVHHAVEKIEAILNSLEI